MFLLNLPPYCSEVARWLTVCPIRFISRCFLIGKGYFSRLFLPSVFQGVVKELFSQFGCVQSVELMDHPGSSQETGPKLSSFFKPVAKQVSTFNLNSVSKHSMHFKCSVNFVCHFALECSHSIFFSPVLIPGLSVLVFTKYRCDT